ncbi:MAG: class F sortase [Nocardioidaceae bacterium]
MRTSSDTRSPASAEGPGTGIVLALAAVGAVLLVAGGLAMAGVFSGRGNEASAAVVEGESSTTASAAGQVIEPRVQLSTRPYDPTEYAGTPTEVRIPGLGIRVPVVPIQADGGVLVPPSNPRELGWWTGGAKPGAARGSAVITGHTVHTGGGALDKLKTLRPDDSVFVSTAKGTLRYDVRQVRDLTKDQLARQSADVFDNQVPGRLVLITCSGWDGRAYLANTVVYADPVAPS